MLLPRERLRWELCCYDTLGDTICRRRAVHGSVDLFSAMNRDSSGRNRGLRGGSYCIFFAPMEELVTQDRMTGREDQVVLELLYGDEMLPGALRVRQVGSNAVVEESTQGRFAPSWRRSRSSTSDNC